MEAAATLCLLLRSKAEYSGSSSGTSRSLLRLDLRSGPKVGRGGAPGDAPRFAGTGWAGGGGLAEFYSIAPFSTPPTIFRRAAWGSRWVLLLFLCFISLRSVKSSSPRAGCTRPSRTRVPAAESPRPAPSPPPPRLEPTCQSRRAEPLRFGLAGGQAASPAAAQLG